VPHPAARELEALLADAEPGCGEAMIATAARYPHEALEAMPRLRAVLAPLLWSLQQPLPASAPGGGATGREELDVEALPEAQQITLWPYRPKREPDELFSSWLWRIARGHGAPPKHFARDMIGSCLTDIDRDISDTAIRRLAFLSGQPHGHLLNGTMRPDAAADPGDLRGRVQQRLLRHGDLVLNRSRRGRGGRVPVIQYCPGCLRDELAYLRRGWRFSPGSPVSSTALSARCLLAVRRFARSPGADRAVGRVSLRPVQRAARRGAMPVCAGQRA
jgi:hypothetical protein